MFGSSGGGASSSSAAAGGSATAKSAPAGRPRTHTGLTGKAPEKIDRVVRTLEGLKKLALVAAQEHFDRLVAARLQADIMGAATV